MDVMLGRGRLEMRNTQRGNNLLCELGQDSSPVWASISSPVEWNGSVGLDQWLSSGFQLAESQPLRYYLFGLGRSVGTGSF